MDCNRRSLRNWNMLLLRVALLLVFSLFLSHHLTKSFAPTWSSILHTPASAGAAFEPIPNIVHFVRLVHPAPEPVLEFQFRHFIAIYSAWYHLEPAAIYIHTNIEQYLIEEALDRSASIYTAAVRRIPRVTFSHQVALNHTKSGAVIDKLPNQSDFVRTAVMVKQGGIYLDDDAYVLRDLKPLRTLGFENVVGRQANGQ